ncbi:carboxyl-terminal processing protease [Parelusimicrobium proximum]|uniref:S41 family peptidase n=1 Tax=Parelusimicrobium proximum TaxID=3228953 RepID=UPI003D17CDA3
MNKGINKQAILLAVVFFIGTLFPKAYSAMDGGIKSFRTLIDVVDKVKDNYVEDKPTEDLITGAMKGVMNSLDPFSEFMSKKELESLRADTKGEFGGIGIRLIHKDTYLEVSTPMPDTPAYEAKILPKDRILMIDGVDVKTLSQDEAVERMRGKPGTKVKLTVSRKNDKTGKFETLPVFTLKRAKIVPQIVYSKMLEDNIGYIYVVDFSGHTTEKLQAAVKDLQKSGMKALILDLRFNPGGLLNSAVEMSGFFLGGNQKIVYTQGRKQEFYQEYKSPSKAKYGDIPLIVMVNEASASGSEIVAGAMQDYKRAVIVGARTYGKASVQQVFQLADGSAIRLTIARYYTPLGRLIHRDYRDKTKSNVGGIWPDEEIKIPNQEALKIFSVYNNAVYYPGKPPQIDTPKDAALDKAVEILKDKEAYEAALGKGIITAEKALEKSDNPEEDENDNIEAEEAK